MSLIINATDHHEAIDDYTISNNTNYNKQFWSYMYIQHIKAGLLYLAKFARNMPVICTLHLQCRQKHAYIYSLYTCL